MQPATRNSNSVAFSAKSYVSGFATGELLYTDTALSFWGGVAPDSGKIIDHHHPLYDKSIANKILALPSGRGSCTGSAIILELLMNGQAPAGLILAERDEILIIGVLVAKLFFGLSLPILVVNKETFSALYSTKTVTMGNNQLKFGLSDNDDIKDIAGPLINAGTKLDLTQRDQDMLCGKYGKATKLAMEVICHMASCQETTQLIEISQAHIDACIYTGKGVLAFAEKLKNDGAKVCIPTTLNSISIDAQRWKKQGVEANEGIPAQALAKCYEAIGAKPTFTCAPYLLSSAPQKNQQIGWAESNAVVFANSVIGAHTQKYPDFMDVCIALTGRAPASGCHIQALRKPSMRIKVSAPRVIDDSFYPLLGYTAGQLAQHEIPLITGIGHLNPSRDDLKAMGAAFATTSSAPMFHIENVTPEICDNASWLNLNLPEFEIRTNTLLSVWKTLNQSDVDCVDMVALGNPHFSVNEALILARLCEGKTKSEKIDFKITMGRACFSQLKQQDEYETLIRFGATFITDTCWCMIKSPIIKNHVKVILTNSGKYAHYGAGLTGCDMRFGSLNDCVNAAIMGRLDQAPPQWLKTQ